MPRFEVEEESRAEELVELVAVDAAAAVGVRGSEEGVHLTGGDATGGSAAGEQEGIVAVFRGEEGAEHGGPLRVGHPSD